VPTDSGSSPVTIPEDVAPLTALLPADTRGVLTFDADTMLIDDPSPSVAALINGEAGDPAWNELVGGFASLAASVGDPEATSAAILVRTTDPTDGPFLLASLPPEGIDAVVADDVAEVDTSASATVYLADLGNHLALLPDDVVVVGSLSAVTSVLDVTDGTSAADASAVVPFLDTLGADADLAFVYGLPALFDEDAEPDRTLRSAALVSGALTVDGDDIGGSMSFHTANAEAFVDTYNRLDRHAIQADAGDEEDPDDADDSADADDADDADVDDEAEDVVRAAAAPALPLTLAEPLAGDLGQVVVTIPSSPIDPSPDELFASRNLAKKLFVGMDAHDYAEGVDDGTNLAWFDFLVLSEQDEVTPQSPGSVFIRWKFRDEAAIEAFEENELPEGFTLAPTRFLESDDPDGEYFLALNIYNAGGNSIVSGARAEWDVFVNPPEGADPDAGERPRFMVVEALAEEVSADATNLLTPAEPLAHELVDG
jgi:hypothetical protein